MLVAFLVNIGHDGFSANIQFSTMLQDPETCKKLIPNYDMGCKRITPSDTYLQAFNKVDYCGGGIPCEQRWNSWTSI
jgi:hypothetical protein